MQFMKKVLLFCIFFWFLKLSSEKQGKLEKSGKPTSENSHIIKGMKDKSVQIPFLF